MVGDAILRIVVSADFFGALGAADGGFSLVFDVAEAFFFLCFPKLGTEHLQGYGAVLLLGALLAAGDGDTRGFVGEPNGGVDFVDVLAAVAAGPDKLPFEVFFPDFKVLGFDDGEDGD